VPAAAAPESPVVHRAPETESVSGRPGAVLTFGGEKVVLPFVEHADEAAKESPALTLDRLEEAFAHLGEPAPSAGVNAPAAAEAAPAAEPAAAATARPATGTSSSDGDRYEDHSALQPRARRPRRNRSASRAQGAANETSVEHHETAPAPAAGHSHAAKAPDAEKVAAAKPANEPIILGVGVPASEL
jgi:ribonuclease E